MKDRLYTIFFAPVSIAPLVVFRILFGCSVLFSTIRFVALGWIDLHFVNTQVQFSYFGFEWVKPLPAIAMYVIHGVMILCAIGIILGAWYRLSAILFFLCFTYCELIDVTYYLNHYYFVSIIAGWMCLLPAHRLCSADVWFNRVKQLSTVSSWHVGVIKLQLLLVYFFAGIAKINSEWLLHAMPLKIWLPANDTLWLIGPLFRLPEMAYIFSWAGMLFDVCIGYFLLRRQTVYFAWTVVVCFHVLTGIMFQIGVFPLVMILSTVIFFPISFHEKVLHFCMRLFGQMTHVTSPVVSANQKQGLIMVSVGIWFLFQFLFPFRYVLYPGNVYWTEEGYRFSWRVMLMEKAGTATFYVTDSTTKKEGVVDNSEVLNPHQEKQMAMQPDLILQYAHYLKKYYEAKNISVSKVRAEVYVTWNGRPSRLYIDSSVNLLSIRDSWAPKKWIIPYEN